MNFTQTMKELKRLSDADWLSLMPKHGISGPAFGVRYADLYKIRDKIKTDHELALKLWDTGNHDARILATMIVDAERITSRQLDSWIGAAPNQVLNFAVAGVAIGSPHAAKKADAWRKAKNDWKSAAGWDVVSGMAATGTATDAWLKARLTEIGKTIDSAPNRTRHSMNASLISIGGYRPALKAAALKTAKAIGKVVVDHGQTSCKTPDATAYIKKMAIRQAAKTKKKKAKKKAAKR